MTEFNRLTIVAATEVICSFHSHDDMELLEVQWGINGRCSGSSKSKRAADWSRIAIEDDLRVMTEQGLTTLPRAVIETAITAPPHSQETPAWKKLVAALRFDGFEITRTKLESGMPDWMTSSGGAAETVTLTRMLPDDVPGLDFREAQSEVESLLDRHGFVVAKGHLQMALSAFQLGNWSSSNGELRKFYEGYLNDIADRLGYSGTGDSKAKRDFLGQGVTPPFLLADYNEWDANKTQYVQGLMNRMHPHGGHPGLSEEEDATFRLQIILVTARLFLRRFDQR